MSSAASTTPRPLAVALVGCGIIGVNHSRVIVRHPDLRIVALVDSVPEASHRLADLIADELGAGRPAEFASLGDALAASSVDLVVICTPSGLHVQLAEEALAAGTHVVIEKPLDVTLPRARRIAALAAEAESRGSVVSVISQHRFDPASVAVARAAHDGAFGRITSGVASVAWWRSQEYYDSGQWRGTWALDGGGAVMNQGVHTVDLLVWFLGRPVEIFAHTALLAHERVEVEDVAVATVRFESGALAVLHATTAAYPGLSVRLQVHGSAGSAVIDDDQLEYFYAAGEGEPRNQAAEQVGASDLRGADKGPDGFIVGHLRQYEDIVDAIRTGRQPGVRVEDALVSLAVVRAVYLSATLGTPVSFEAVLAGDFDDVDVTAGVFADVLAGGAK
ncbi:Gfo/Idh/MocA family oxidoreductase [Lacisediminihabitans sp.]|jgi:predicted dehydrogenase|uniref:Gfo/Idh/MocA family protein n=1 Tax=Lacisediminihabitans sp. TaxID=2787631 RepID=UPI002F92D5BC